MSSLYMQVYYNLRDRIEGVRGTQRFTRVDMNFVQRPSRDRECFSTHYLLYYIVGHNRYIIYCPGIYIVQKYAARNGHRARHIVGDQGPLVREKKMKRKITYRYIYIGIARYIICDRIQTNIIIILYHHEYVKSKIYPYSKGLEGANDVILIQMRRVLYTTPSRCR